MSEFPVVCIIGSMRFWHEMLMVANQETANGVIMLMPFVTKGHGTDGEMLDRMHRQKMDMAKFIILVTDTNKYIGESTQGELEYATSTMKPVLVITPDETYWYLEKS